MLPPPVGCGVYAFVRPGKPLNDSMKLRTRWRWVTPALKAATNISNASHASAVNGPGAAPKRVPNALTKLAAAGSVDPIRSAHAHAAIVPLPAAPARVRKAPVRSVSAPRRATPFRPTALIAVARCAPLAEPPP